MSHFEKITKTQVQSRINKNGKWEGIMVPALELPTSEHAQKIICNSINDFLKQYNAADLNVAASFSKNLAFYEEIKNE